MSDRASSLVAGHEQAAADHERLFGAGTIGYCPLCARPMSDRPTLPVLAMALVADHLAAEHDPFFSAILSLRLARS